MCRNCTALRGFKTSFVTIFLLPSLVIADSYSDCLMTMYAKKFFCKTSSQNAFVEPTMMNESSLFCPNKKIIFVGDSFMWELYSFFNCLCPNNEVQMIGGGRISKPLSKSLRKYRKKFHPNSLVVLNFGLWYNVEKMKPYIKELHMIERDLNNYQRSDSFPEVIFIQTIAQHFCSKGGIFKKYLKGKNCCDISKHNTFRQKYAMEFLIKPLKLAYFDGFEVTKNWFDAHPGEGDCTHLCANENGPLMSFGLKFMSFLQKHNLSKENEQKKIDSSL